jgi:hypothetical protein
MTSNTIYCIDNYIYGNALLLIWSVMSGWVKICGVPNSILFLTYQDMLYKPLHQCHLANNTKCLNANYSELSVVGYF